MVLSWSLIEIVRYPIYAISLLNLFQTPHFLTWLRYSMFFVLYPIGALSEAGLIYATLPERGAKWGVADVARAMVFTIQWPGQFLYSSQKCSLF
jgi:very-long-chain (3R)-3-hydroxyacyl-CoA dehydratase